MQRMIQLCLRAVAVGSLAVITLSTHAADRQWPVFRGDAALSGVAPGSLAVPTKLAWEFQAHDGIQGSAVISDNRVFFGDSSGCIYALDLKTGKELWTFETKDSIEASPLRVGPLVVVGSLDGKIYALNAKDGKPSWTYSTDDRILGSANATRASDGEAIHILVGGYDNTLHALDLRGKPSWTYTTDSFINGAPAIAGDTAIFGGCDATLHIVSISNGTKRATVDLGAYAAASPAIRKGRAYVGHYGGQLHCIDLASPPRILWSYGDEDGGEAFLSSPAITEQRVIVGCRDKKLHCINAADGSAMWTFKTGGDVDSSPVICDGKVVFGSRDGRLYMVGLAKGNALWRYDAGSPILASPAVVNGTLVVATTGGQVLAWRTTQP